MGLEVNAPDATLATLGRFVAAAACERLPQAVVQKAKACLLYGLAVGIASVRAPQPRQAALATDLESSARARGATRLIDGRQLDYPAAAFCNSVLFHSRVQDDSHPCGHLGGVVIPAALAAAECVDATGSDALAAIVSGYEVALRIGRDHAADLSERGFRTTSAYGPFAAAACGARLMKLDASASKNALSLAANTAAGLREWSDAGTEEGPFQVGLAARSGLLAANMAAAGAVAASSALTGRAGFFRAYATDSDRYARRVCDGLGEEFELEKITCKPYPICQFLTGVVRGMIELRARAGNRRPRAVAIHMHPFEADFVGIRSAGPFKSFPQTLMSAPFCAALGWVRQAVTFDGMHNFTDEAVLALVREIAVVSDPSRARYSPRLAVTLDDSTALEWDETEGAYAYRLTWDTAMQMNIELCAEVGIPEEKARALASAVVEIDRATNVRKVVQTAAECAANAQRAESRRDGQGRRSA